MSLKKSLEKSHHFLLWTTNSKLPFPYLSLKRIQVRIRTNDADLYHLCGLKSWQQRDSGTRAWGVGRMCRTKEWGRQYSSPAEAVFSCSLISNSVRVGGTASKSWPRSALERTVVARSSRRTSRVVCWTMSSPA